MADSLHVVHTQVTIWPAVSVQDTQMIPASAAMVRGLSSSPMTWVWGW